MSTVTYKIFGLDCVEEVRIIKETLSHEINSDSLQFDLINGKLIIRDLPESFNQNKLQKLLDSTGLKAVEWSKYILSQQAQASFWSRNGRALLALLSFIFLITGFGYHAMSHGIYDAISGGVDDLATSHSYPPQSILFYAAAILSGGRYIFPKALMAIKRFSPDMNLLMTIAVFGALCISQWFEAATVTVLFSIALLLESWSIGRARKAIKNLLSLTPDTAYCYCPKNKKFQLTDIHEIEIHSIIRVKPGDKIPLDGIINQGQANLNESPITGESMTVDKHAGDIVYAGSINGNTSFEFKTTKRADDTTLAHIIHMIEKAQARRADSEKWVEKFARIYTPIMILFAILIASIPPLLLQQAWIAWFYEALVILVIACPCALVISTPVSIVAGLSSAARNGILIKGGNFLERPASINAIAFDKTGTLTAGTPKIQEIIPLSNHSAQHLLSIAAAIEAHSNHPLAQAIVTSAQERGISIPQAVDFKLHQGKGAEASINGRYYWIGSYRWLHEKFPSQENVKFHQQAQFLEDKGHSLIIIGSSDHICGLLSIADSLKPEAINVIARLKNMGLAYIAMLTGDNKGTAKAIANHLKLDHYAAELLPQDKLHKIKSLNRQYDFVAMVGDGINDAPAMATSSLGIAMGAIGSDAAIETADIALMSDDLNQIPRLIQHSKRTLSIIKQNISFALMTKGVFIILALMELASLWMAIAADMGASLIVIFNALRLLTMKKTNEVIPKTKI